jgi:photosystem II stability/assembly factor-like uncharacterized protein
MTNPDDLLAEELDQRNTRLIQQLRLLYGSDAQKARHLARIQRGLLTNEDDLRGDQQNEHSSMLSSGEPSRAKKRTTLEAHRDVPRGGGWGHRLNMIAAAVFAALVVGSLLLVSYRAHQSRAGIQGNAGVPSKITGGLGHLLSFHMIDTTTGWALSQQAVLRTTDGGSHWQTVSPPKITLAQDSIADFLSASTAWIAARQAGGTTTQIAHTTDGGRTWQQTTIQAAFPKEISFIDAQHGWLLAGWQQPGGAAEAASVFRTADGGKTWMEVATALFSDTTPPGHLPYGGQKSGIRFLSASTGWVTGTVSVPDLAWLYVSYDGGSTWDQQSLPMPSGVPSARLSITSPTFFSASAAILPVTFVQPTTGSAIAIAIYVTDDGGSTWRSTTPLPGALSIIDFVDLQHGWASDGTLLYRTADGGTHWAKLSPSGNFQNVSHLDFVSDQVGWAISSPSPGSSSVLKTADGGQTWTVLAATNS